MMSGNYGLPVPQHSAKLGGSSLFLHHSRAGSVDSSGRNSPVQGWGENGQVTTVYVIISASFRLVNTCIKSHILE